MKCLLALMAEVAAIINAQPPVPVATRHSYEGQLLSKLRVWALSPLQGQVQVYVCHVLGQVAQATPAKHVGNGSQIKRVVFPQEQLCTTEGKGHLVTGLLW